MEQRLKNHIDAIFQNMPQNQDAQEIKEEILQNLIDKYYDLLAEGKDEETAYSIAVASIGDISGLFQHTPVVDPTVLQKQKSRSALLTSIAIMLYILSVIPPIIFASTPFTDTLGPILMFVMVAIATGLLIYNSKIKISKGPQSETIVNEFKEWQAGNPSRKSKMNSIKGVLWSLTVLVYLVVSFFTMAWYITWLIFIVAVAVEQIIKLCFTMKD